MPFLGGHLTRPQGLSTVRLTPQLPDHPLVVRLLTPVESRMLAWCPRDFPGSGILCGAGRSWTFASV